MAFPMKKLKNIYSDYPMVTGMREIESGRSENDLPLFWVHLWEGEKMQIQMP